MTLEEMKLQYIEHCLIMFNGNKAKTAKYLGVSARFFSYNKEKLNELNIKVKNKLEIEKETGFIFPTNKERLEYLDKGCR